MGLRAKKGFKGSISIEPSIAWAPFIVCLKLEIKTSSAGEHVVVRKHRLKDLLRGETLAKWTLELAKVLVRQRRRFNAAEFTSTTGP